MKQAFRKIRYAILELRYGGLRTFFRQLRRQVYSRATFLGLEKALDGKNTPIPCGIRYSLRPASGKDMEEVLQRARTESKESVHELIQRKWFYESGFRNCYVGRTDNGDELCYIQWLVSSEDREAMNHGFKGRLPRLKEDEVLVENVFTFQKYRRKGVMSSAVVELAEIAREKGFKRMLAYVREDNIASLKAFEKAGFKKFEEIPEVKFLFFTKRKHR